MAEAPYTEESEQWRDIPGWPHYQASSRGRIRSLERTRVQLMRDGSMQPVLYPARILRQSPCPRTRYLKVGLSNRGNRRTCAVHTLVCSAFHGERPPKHDTAHANGNRADNRPENLRWCTRKENLADRVAHGTMNTGNRNGMSHHAKRLRAALRHEEV